MIRRLTGGRVGGRPVLKALGGCQPRSHSHSHGHGGCNHHHGHGHSHGSIESSIQGRNLLDCQVATIAGGLTNIFFCATKIWFGSAGGSVALLADGFHALTDLVADVVSYVSISFSHMKLPRCRYPFGVGRLETSGAVLVAAILFFGGLALLWTSAEHCIADARRLLSGSAGGIHHDHHDHGEEGLHGHAHSHEGHGHSHFEVMQRDAATGEQVVLWTMVILAASSVVCKEILFQWTKRVGERAGSRVVVANAFHHRADAWSGGVALVGVAGQCAGIPGLDGIAGLVVSLSISKIGLTLFRDSVREFFDCQNDAEVSQVREQLQRFYLEDGRGIYPPHFQSHQCCREGTTETAVENSSPPNNTVEASSTEPHILSTSASSSMEHDIRFINVFLMRHGHSYALHVTLLVFEHITVEQVRLATDLLTGLAKSSLPIRDTFISLKVCSPHTVSREAYMEEDASKRGKTSTTDVEGQEGPRIIAATGDLVNPALERVLASLNAFHLFDTPLTYCWETREIFMQHCGKSSSDCARDVSSVGQHFKCTVVMGK